MALRSRARSRFDSRSRSARERAARAIRDRVVATEVPPVLAGDFNSTLDDLPETTAVEILAGTNLFSLVPPPTELAFTFPSEQPRRSIDWIMVPSRWNVLTHRVVPSKLSDHLMVTATVRPPPRSDDP